MDMTTILYLNLDQPKSSRKIPIKHEKVRELSFENPVILLLSGQKLHDVKLALPEGGGNSGGRPGHKIEAFANSVHHLAAKNWVANHFFLGPYLKESVLRESP